MKRMKTLLAILAGMLMLIGAAGVQASPDDVTMDVVDPSDHDARGHDIDLPDARDNHREDSDSDHDRHEDSDRDDDRDEDSDHDRDDDSSSDRDDDSDHDRDDDKNDSDKPESSDD